MTKLCPCPFCGSLSLTVGTAAGSSVTRIACGNCYATGPSASTRDPRPWDAAAAEEWNRWVAGFQMSHIPLRGTIS